MKNIHTRLIGLIFTSLLLGTTGFAATELAKVNGSVITLEEFNKKYQDNLKHFPFKAPKKRDVLDDIIKRELGIQEAKKMGLDKNPEVIDQMNSVLFSALLNQKMSKELEKINVTDADAKSYYGRNPEIRTSHIFVAVPPSATSEQEKQARDKINSIYHNEVRPGKQGFAEIAQKFSEGPTASIGGDMGYQTKESLDPAYYSTAVKLGKPGAISSPIRSPFGYHIIKVTGVRPWREADKGQVKRLIFEEKRNRLFESYMKSLENKATVKINTNLIRE